MMSAVILSLTDSLCPGKLVTGHFAPWMFRQLTGRFAPDSGRYAPVSGHFALTFKLRNALLSY